jgi:hypothetical protein
VAAPGAGTHHNPRTAVSSYSRAKARPDKQMLTLARHEAKEAKEEPSHVETEPWRVHDLRRTLATGMQRLGVRFRSDRSYPEP